MSNKREKFVELAEKRVTKTINDLRLIGNLSNKNNYSYTEDDVQKITQALEKEVKLLKAKFTSDSGKLNSTFTL